MSVTIQDIAREANVSVATVSRVINNSKPVSPELKKRVNDVIQKRNFKPNALARGLITKQTNSIGIIVPDISNPVFGALTRGINSFCQQKDYILMVCESGGQQDKEIELLDVLADKKVDGVLFAGVDINATLVEAMNSKAYPVVLVTQEEAAEEGAVYTVIHDNWQAMYDATCFLIDHGHSRIAFIGGPENDYSSGMKRLKGYQAAMKENGIEVPASYIEHGNFTFESGYDCMRKLYEENNTLPTAVMACNDLMAIGAIRFLKQAKVSVPNDISIIGFDDLEIGKYFSPELTTVRISYFEEGLKAVKTLFKLVQNKHQIIPKVQFIPHKIIRRNSVRKL